jgi:hypothetical protein
MKFIALAATSDHKPLTALNECIDKYTAIDFPKKVVDTLVSFLDKDKKLDSVFGDTNVNNYLDDILGYKMLNFFCKAKKDDKIVVGFMSPYVLLLERCKPLNIEASFNSYNYKVYKVMMDDIQSFKKETYNVEDLKELNSYDALYKLIDKAEDTMRNHKKFFDEIHDIISNDNNFDAITDKLTWENKGFLNVFSFVIFSIANTYQDVVVGVDGFTKIIAQNLDRINEE